VYVALRRAILRLELAPGAVVREVDVAASLSVCLGQASSAVRRLERCGLVDRRSDGYVLVSRVSLAQMWDAQFVREALECAAVRLAACQASRQDVRLLDRIVSRQEASAHCFDLEGFLALDDQFHMTVCELSGHPVWCMTQEFGVPLTRVRRLSLTLPSSASARATEHRSVVAAVRARDPAGAEAALRQHLRAVASTVDRLRVLYPHYFVDADGYASKSS
jgi:DNA-binding GntR family transcriptional regulator